MRRFLHYSKTVSGHREPQISMRTSYLDLRVATVLAALVSATTLVCSTAAAEGSAERGQQRAATCSACHGADGNSLNPEWPNLAGQHPKYIERSLKSYRPGGGRNNVLMLGQVSALSDQDMQDLGAYYATKNIQTRTADPALVEAGERLYRGGSRERGISACIACPGPPSTRPCPDSTRSTQPTSCACIRAANARTRAASRCAISPPR